jgi:hypothetical protein
MTRRSTIWRRSADGWKILYHQKWHPPPTLRETGSTPAWLTEIADQCSCVGAAVPSDQVLTGIKNTVSPP